MVSAIKSGGPPALFSSAVGTYALTDRDGLRLQVGAQRWPTGQVEVRDGTLGTTHRLLNKSDLVIQLSPALSLPFGAVGGAEGFLPLSSKSIDPQLGATLVAGSAWVGTVSVNARVPVYAGSDGVVQGSFGRFDLTAGRRLDGWVPFVGASTVTRLPDSNAGGAFSEVAGLAGAVVALGDRWGLTINARAQAWTTVGKRDYLVAPGLQINRVWAKKAGGDDHHGAAPEGDGHHGEAPGH